MKPPFMLQDGPPSRWQSGTCSPVCCVAKALRVNASEGLPTGLLSAVFCQHLPFHAAGGHQRPAPGGAPQGPVLSLCGGLLWQQPEPDLQRGQQQRQRLPGRGLPGVGGCCSGSPDRQGRRGEYTVLRGLEVCTVHSMLPKWAVGGSCSIHRDTSRADIFQLSHTLPLPGSSPCSRLLHKHRDAFTSSAQLAAPTAVLLRPTAIFACEPWAAAYMQRSGRQCVTVQDPDHHLLLPG